MASERDIMREFLISLGFQIDQIGLRKFTGGIDMATTKAFVLGEAIVGAGKAMVKFTLDIAEGMEKLYYMSQRTGVTANALQAFGRAAAQVGINADDAQAQLQNFFMVMQGPTGIGLHPLMRMLLGGKVPLDPTHQFLGLIEAFKKMKEAGRMATQAIPMAQMFGIDQVTLNNLINNLPKLTAEFEKQQQNLANATPDMQAYVGEMMQLENSSRKADNAIVDLSHQIATKLGPSMRDFLDHSATPFLEWLTRTINKSQSFSELLARMFSDLSGVPLEPGKRMMARGTEGGATATWGGEGGGGGTWSEGSYYHDLASRVTAQYGLPAGLVEAVMQQESGFDPNKIGKAGEKGLMQFMPENIQKYHVANPFDPEQSAMAGGAMLRNLLDMYNQNVPMALARYNWSGKGPMPESTKKYVGQTMDKMVTINAHTEINVTGSGSAKETAKAVGDEQKRVWGDIIRENRNVFALPGTG